MASVLSARKRRRNADNASREREEQQECPVCLEAIDLTKLQHFPCGHIVCRTCDQKMLQRNDHRCPTCRTPRAGVSREAADAHATRQLHLDMAEEADHEMGGMGGVGRRIRTPHGPTTIFFPNEAQGDVFEQINAAIAAGIGRRRPGTAPRNVTIFAEFARLDERHLEAQRVRRSTRSTRTTPTSEARIVHDTADRTIVNLTTSEDNLNESLSRLVSELISPSSLATFMAVREQVR